MSEPEPTPIRLDFEDDIAWITFDSPGEKVNTLSRAVMERLETILSELEARPEVGGGIITSAKDGMFLAGADVAEFQTITDGEIAASAVRAGQAIMDRVEALPFPVVAAIGGVCLGGGTEIALACDARVGSDHPRFQIGLPEVNLGILPAWGGTTRLPRLIGLQKALEFILRGRGIDAKRAERLGIIDRAVAHAELGRRALELLRDLQDGKKPKRRKRSLAEWLLTANPIGRSLLFSQAKKRALAQTQGHYPAPLAIIDVLREGRRSRRRSLELEVARAKELLPGDVSKSLVHLFFLNEAAKKDPGTGASPRSIEAAALLGAGTMGGGIARILSSADVSVRLKDISPDALGQGLRAARAIFEKRRKRRRITRWELERRMALITTTLDFSGFRRADVVIEAIVEDLAIKKSVLGELEPHVSADCIIATNTSTLSVSDMQSVLGDPARMAGFHFFNPVDRMPLIEVIRGKDTDDATVASLVALAKRLGKTPVLVNDGPGFLVNRILGPYLNEAGHFLAEYGNVEAIDRAFVDFGMPMGPLRLLDEVGLDVAQKAGKVLNAAFGERAAPSPVVDKLVAEGRLGKKSGRGFYRYDGKPGKRGKPGKKEMPDATVLALAGVDRKQVPAAELIERGIGLMVAEAARCLDDNIVASAGELDLAMVMGTGFPPFRGGLLRYADGYGLNRIADNLKKWQDERGSRFEPPESLSARKSFY
ncbi:MAG: fatty acid oxidation complex subunit alpha FadJ [Acidobacteriota bacterium]|nr:MAG: fatty acid oxidation complex subunit alpha FadJ [Acidobacteriota bacterium]